MSTENHSTEDLPDRLVEALEPIRMVPWFLMGFCADAETVQLAEALLSKLNALTSPCPTPPPERSPNALERFSYAKEQDDWPLQYAEYRANPEWTRIYSFLRQGYWHVTSAEGWGAIRDSGAIKPNTGGRYPQRFSTSDRSYAHIHNCVSLFDFVSPSEEEVIQQWGNACDVLCEGTVLLQLDRQLLEPNIILNRDVWGHEVGYTCLLIPFVEAWYAGEIPTAVITGRFRLPPVHGLSEFRPEPFLDA
jgi:hypothetical protein